MRWLMRHCGKSMALVMMLVQVSGARIINVTDPLAGNRTFFTAERGTKGYLAAVTKRDMRKKAGASVVAKRHSASDMDKMCKGGRVYPTPVLPLAGVVSMNPPARPGPLETRRLPYELSPVQPPHLHTKK